MKTFGHMLLSREFFILLVLKHQCFVHLIKGRETGEERKKKKKLREALITHPFCHTSPKPKFPPYRLLIWECKSPVEIKMLRLSRHITWLMKLHTPTHTCRLPSAISRPPEKVFFQDWVSCFKTAFQKRFAYLRWYHLPNTLSRALPIQWQSRFIRSGEIPRWRGRLRCGWALIVCPVNGKDVALASAEAFNLLGAIVGSGHRSSPRLSLISSLLVWSKSSENSFRHLKTCVCVCVCVCMCVCVCVCIYVYIYTSKGYDVEGWCAN